MAVDKDSGILFGCTFCTLEFPTKNDKNAHTLSHFQQKHCDGCNQNLICVADAWYQAHVNENCVVIKEEIDHDRPIEFECVNLGEQEHGIRYENTTSVKIEPEITSKPVESDVSSVSFSQAGKRILRVKKKLNCCEICQATYKLASSLIRHRRHAHRNEIMANSPFTCDSCVLPFTNKYFFQRHMSEKHGIKNALENEESNNAAQLPADDEGDSANSPLFTINEKKMTENFDDFSMGSKEDLPLESAVEHTHETTSETSVFDKVLHRCRLCSATYTLASSLIRHRRFIHRNEIMVDSPFTCDLCVLPFTNKYFFRRHMSDKHGINNIPDKQMIGASDDVLPTDPNIPVDAAFLSDCDESDNIPIIDCLNSKESENNDDSEEDGSVESSDQSIPDTPLDKITNRCEICSATYSSASCLIRHKRHAHRAEGMASSPFACEECVLPFTSKYFYHRHLLEKHGAVDSLEESQSNETNQDSTIQCDDVFMNDNEDLENIHLVDDIDLKEFKNQNDSNAESEEESPSEASVNQSPPETNSEAAVLNKLMNRCDICSTTYSSASCLIRHKRYVHRNETMANSPFTCEECVLPFTSKYFYRRHLIEKHGVDNLPDKLQPASTNSSEQPEEQSIPSDIEDLENAPSMDSCDFENFTKNQRFPSCDSDDSSKSGNRPGTSAGKNDCGPNTRRCDLCPATYQTMSSLLKHRRHAHPSQCMEESRFKCDICVLPFKMEYHYTRHMLEKHDIHVVITQEGPEPSTSDQAENDETNFHQDTSLLDKKKPIQSDPLTEPSLNRSRKPKTKCCPLCPAKYSLASSLLRHKRTEHSEQIKADWNLQCDQCSERFKDKRFFMKHMFKKHGVGNLAVLEKMRTIQCPLCDLRCEHPSTLIKHKRVKHKEELVAIGWLECEICKLPYESQLKLERHLIDGHGVTETENYRAEAVAVSVEKTRGQSTRLKQKPNAMLPTSSGRPRKIILRRKRFICSLCPAVFHNPSTFASHRRTKHRAKILKVHPKPSKYPDPPLKYRCTACPMSYTTMNSLCRHRRHNHSSLRKTFGCHVCAEQFFTIEKLRQHMFEEHNKTLIPHKPRFICYECQMPYGSPHLLVNHMKTHSNVEFKCCIEPCNEQFEAPDELYEHLLKHLRVDRADTRKTCDKCNKTYLLWNFVGHNCTTEVRPKYMCDHCGRMFRYPDRLRAHINIHTGARPFKCSTCNKTFSHKTVLRQHETIHSNLRPLKCKVEDCGQAFKLHKQLHLHEFNAHGIYRTAHTCTICNRIFHEKVLLRNHMKSHHGISSEPL